MPYYNADEEDDRPIISDTQADKMISAILLIIITIFRTSTYLPFCLAETVG